MSNPKVSIIVPVYNAEAYLGTCLESLINQTLQDIEIICIDDGSTDDSAAVLSTFAGRDPRITVLSQSNAGVACTRNRGLDSTHGDYILFVDADDFIALRACEVLYCRALEERADIVVFGGKSFPSSEWADQSFAQRTKTYRKNGVKALLEEPGANPLMCNKLYSASLLRTLGVRFNEALVLGEDNAFQFALFPRASTIAFIDDALYFYRQHCDSAVLARMDDHDTKLFLHFEIVKYVVQTWEKQGFIAGNEQALYAWAIRLLYTEAAQATFNERVRFSQEFNAFFESRIQPNDGYLSDSEIVRFYEFMKESPSVVEKAPKFSVFFCSTGVSDEKEMRKSLESIAFQTEQALEIVVMQPCDSKAAGDDLSAHHDAISCFLKKDARARFVESSDYREVIASMRGAYVLCLPLNAVLNRSTLQYAAEAIEVSRVSGGIVDGVDVFTFLDYGGLLRCKDVFSVCEPSTTADMRGFWALTPEELGSHLFEVSSLALANKIIKRTHFVEILNKGESSLGSLAAQVMVHANHLIQLKGPLVSFFPLRFSDSHVVLVAAQSLVDSCRSLSPAACDTVPERCLQGSLAVLLLSYLELLRQGDMFAIAHEVIQRYLVELFVPTMVRESDGLSASDVARVEAVCTLDGPACFAALNEMLVDELMETQRNAMFDAQEQRKQVQQYRAEMSDFYDSISYRVGRTVTAVPRSAVRLINKHFGK